MDTFFDTQKVKLCGRVASSGIFCGIWETSQMGGGGGAGEELCVLISKMIICIVATVLFSGVGFGKNDSPLNIYLKKHCNIHICSRGCSDVKH